MPSSSASAVASRRIPAKFLAVIGAREDEGLLTPCVANLRRVGFDRIVVLCVEDFIEQLSSLQQDFATQRDVSFHTFAGDLTTTSLYELDGPIFGPILEQFSPEWMTFVDVDEFAAIAGVHLTDAADWDNADLVKIQRYNFARPQSEAEQQTLDRLGDPETIPIIGTREKVDPTANADGPRWIGHAIGPRVVIRPERYTTFTLGFHNATGWLGANSPRRLETSEACMVHVPFSSMRRFNQKVQNVQAHLSRSEIMSGISGWHWKWWLQQFEAGNLKAVFDYEAFDDQEIAELVANGTITTPQVLLAN